MKTRGRCLHCANPLTVGADRPKGYCSDRCEFDAFVARFWDRVVIADGCWEWQGYRDPRGYGEVGVLARVERTHRVVYEFFHGPIPLGLEVLHSCDNPPCVRPDHLFLGTQADNLADMAKKGRGAIGERHGRAKLSQDDVASIRYRARMGVQADRLARSYGVTAQHIRDILCGKVWRE